MKKILFATSLILTVVNIKAQQFDFNLEDHWSDKPTLHQVHKQYDSSSAIGILDARRIEYKTEKDAMFIYEYDHSIVRITNDNGIEAFNKIFIPEYANSEITGIQARAILPNGKIINLDPNSIKETEDENGTYKQFAMDGLEIGCEVEYEYTTKRPLSIFGSEVFQRKSMPYQEAKFLLITPSYLKFEAKGYNGFHISEDSVKDEQRYIAGYSSDIDEMDDEKYAETDPFLQRVDYKLSYNLSKNAEVRLYTWKEFAKESFTSYTTRTAKEDKAVDGFIAKMKVANDLKEANKILAIEDYIKTNINIDKKLISDDAANLEAIVKTKAADDEGVVRLFAAIFDKLNINYQFVFPGDRTGFSLDEQLEDWHRVDDAIFYFPSTGKFMDPVSVELRYPYIPYQYTNIRGLFLKGTVIGDFKTAIGSFAMVPIEPFEEHSVDMNADLRFDESLDTVLVQSKQILRGYGATSYRPIYAFLPADKQEEVNKEIIKSVANSDNISNIKIENKELTDYFDNKPLIISADIKSTELFERAGDRILFKLGEVIGPQEQMYQEKPRKLPVQLPFPHSLNRKIVFHIPDGYTVKNPNDINMSVEYKDNDGQVTMGFTSTYTQNGNDITVTITELYKLIDYPLSQFEDFKKVINASADFNKIVLVLQKK